MSGNNSESHDPNWSWTGAHTRQRFQLFTLSLILFCLAKYDVDSIANLAIKFNPSNKPEFLTTYVFFLVFYLYTFVGFWVLSDVETAQKREQEAVISNKFLGFESKFDVFSERLMKQMSELSAWPPLFDKVEGTISKIDRQIELAKSDFSKLENSLENLSRIKVELGDSIATQLDIIQTNILDPQSEANTKRAGRKPYSNLGQELGRLKSSLDLGLYNDPVLPDLRNYLSGRHENSRELIESQTVFRKSLSNIDDAVPRMMEQISILITDFKKLIDENPEKLNALVTQAQKNHASARWLRFWGKWVPILMSSLFVLSSAYFAFFKIKGIS